MGKYYCLVAGLPNIALEDSKLTTSVEAFREELEGILTRSDKKLLDLFFLKFDNKNVIAVCSNRRVNRMCAGESRCVSLMRFTGR